VEINADALAMQSIISNLLDNALKYAPHSTIVIQLRCADKVFLSVSDNGPGIPKEERERIFERFFRLGNEETRTAKGTGIGLYLTRSLVDLHQGEISVENNQPNGTTFIISLPTAEQ